MKYDDASWHSGGDFPADLPPEAGGTHSGMFLAWAILNRLGGDLHSPEEVEGLRTRTLTPGQFFLDVCDGKFTAEDFSEEGNAFARAYYDMSRGQYLRDYEYALGAGLPTLYHVPDTWGTYDVLAPVLDGRLRVWRTQRGGWLSWLRRWRRSR
jgi:hypothetical protein